MSIISSVYNNLNPTISHSWLPTVISCKAPEAAVEKSKKRVVKVLLLLFFVFQVSHTLETQEKKIHQKPEEGNKKYKTHRKMPEENLKR